MPAARARRSSGRRRSGRRSLHNACRRRYVAPVAGAPQESAGGPPPREPSPPGPPDAPIDGRAYLGLVLLGAAIGVPAALVAALFLAFTHDLEGWLWTDLPDALGDALSLLFWGVFAARLVFDGREQIESVSEAAKALLDSAALGRPVKAKKASSGKKPAKKTRR